MNSNNQSIKPRGISLKLIGILLAIFAFIVSGTLVASLSLISYENQVVTKANENYIALKDASNNVQSASDDLTNDVRLFVANADEKYMASYFKEANETKRRETSLDIIHELSKGTSRHEEIHSNITKAVEESMDLMNLEFYAMKLICVEHNISYAKYPEVAAANIEGVAPEDRKTEALNAVLGPEYIQKKDTISYYINSAISFIDDLMHDNGVKAADSLQKLIIFQTAVIVVIIVFIASVTIFMYFYVIRPMSHGIKAIKNRENITIHGNREFNFLADTYNDVRTQNAKVRESLLYEAEHDKLTGLYNRTGYVSIYRGLDLSKTIYVLLDADGFKGINDQHGHEMGDKVLIRVAKTLTKYFKEENAYVFRIGGDEFSVLINNVGDEKTDEIKNRCKQINEELSLPSGRIPPMTLSVGVVHGTDDDTTDSLFRKADKALYKVKKASKIENH